MKANQLVKLIRQLVKEEVSAEVSKAMGKVLVEMVKEIKNNPGPVLNERVTTYRGQEIDDPEPVRAPVINTKNAKLNSALAATAKNFTPLKRTQDSRMSMADMLDEGFDKIGQDQEMSLVDSTPAPANDGTKIGFLKSMINESAGVSNQPSVLDPGAEVPDMLKKVFKKDFRAVMRAIDEKKKFGSSGMISANQVISG